MSQFSDFTQRHELEAEGHTCRLPVACPRCHRGALTAWSGQSGAVHLTCTNGCESANFGRDAGRLLAEVEAALAAGRERRARAPRRQSQQRSDRAGDRAQSAPSVPSALMLGVNRSACGKLPKQAGRGEWRAFNRSFHTERLDLAGLAQAIQAGHAITAVHRGERKRSNFVSAQHIGLDFDTGDQRSSLEVLLQDSFIRRHAALLHTTASHTPAQPRARVLFVLDQPVNRADEYQRLAEALVQRFPAADPACTDASRLWFGAPGCELRIVGKVLNRSGLEAKKSGRAHSRETLRQDPPDPNAAPVPEGRRNDTLASIAGKLRRQGLSADEILGVLRPVNARRCAPPLEDGEVRAIAISVGKYPPGDSPRPADPPEDRGRTPNHVELAGRWHAAHPQTAYGLGEWRRYQDGCWPVVAEPQIEREVLAVLEAATPEGVRPTSNSLSSVIRLLQVKCSLPFDVWDANPDLLVCTNGTLDLETLELRAHDPDDYATAGLGYAYDPQAAAPAFERLLDSAIPAARDFFLEFAGYALTTDTRYEISVWLYGPSGCGKSTLIGALEAMLGPRAGVLGLADLANSRFSLTHLPGKTLVKSTEQPADYVQCSYLLNQIISGETIQVDRKFHQPIKIRPFAKLIWAMNDLPRVSAGNGLFRRVRVISFPPLDESRRDPWLKNAIETERAGMLNLALAGLRRLRRRGGFELPECVQAATDLFQATNDTARLFVEERCLVGPGYRTRGSDLYTAYRDWCEATGHRAKSSTAVAQDWNRLGFEKHLTHNRAVWTGVGLQTARPGGW